MTRPSLVAVHLAVAKLYSLRGTCGRRQVGAVITDHSGHVLATGYNGPPAGARHCTDSPCKGFGKKSGTGLSECEAIHAEMNSLITCRDLSKAHHLIVTVSPCMDCIKVLLNTPIKVISFGEPYAHEEESRKRWQGAARQWHQISHDDQRLAAAIADTFSVMDLPTTLGPSKFTPLESAIIDRSGHRDKGHGSY